MAISAIREGKEDGFERRKIRSCGGLFWVEKILKKRRRSFCFQLFLAVKSLKERESFKKKRREAIGLATLGL